MLELLTLEGMFMSQEQECFCCNSFSLQDLFSCKINILVVIMALGTCLSVYELKWRFLHADTYTYGNHYR
jgi:hypothetical protein